MLLGFFQPEKVLAISQTHLRTNSSMNMLWHQLIQKMEYKVSVWTDQVLLCVPFINPWSNEKASEPWIVYLTFKSLLLGKLHLVCVCFIRVLCHLQHYFSYITATVELFMITGFRLYAQCNFNMHSVITVEMIIWYWIIDTIEVKK